MTGLDLLRVRLDDRCIALQIRDFLSSEFTPRPLADVMAVLRARGSGEIKLVPNGTGK